MENILFRRIRLQKICSNRLIFFAKNSNKPINLNHTRFDLYLKIFQYLLHIITKPNPKLFVSFL